jgi:hypothetical protein
MLKNIILVLAILSFNLSAFQSGKIETTDTLKCSPLEAKNIKCEISGVEIFENSLIFANDKDNKNVSNLFGISYKSSSFFSVNIPDILKLKKIEDLAVSHFLKTLVVTTAFDRIDENSNNLDNYNSIVGLKLNGEVYQIADKNLRKEISETIGHEYFKIEGIEVLHNSIFLGIRETGKNYKKFNYTMTILELPIDIKNNQIILNKNKNIRILMDEKKHNLGISSLKYDSEKDILYILASFESETEKSYSYIFYTSLIDFLNNGPKEILILKNAFGFPLRLEGKAEGITTSLNKLLIVYDDDRNLFNRENFQFRFSVISLNEED